MTNARYEIDRAVAEFMELKRQLLSLCSDPSEIKVRAATDKAFDSLCRRLFFAAFPLSVSEMEAEGGIIAPTGAAFVREWRDYQTRLSRPLSNLVFASLLPAEPAVETKQDSSARTQSEADDLESMIEYVRDRAQEAADEGLDDLDERLRDGLDAWGDLARRGGLDTHGVFRRMKLTPTALVPHSVANREIGRRLSLFVKWADARRSFIYGALHSASAMTRAVLETLLTEVYGLSGNLPSQIREYESRFGRDQALDRIRVVAKFSLHANILHDSEFTAMREQRVADEALSDMEREVAAALLALRKLIEGAPEKGQSPD